jgi:antitoxin component of MazEF toxin-antitoxin module
MKLQNKNTRKLMRLGKASLAVTLPIEMVKALGWREKQKVTAKRVTGGILIKDFRSK